LLNSISSCFRDIGPYEYWGHEFDLSGLLDVIGHVSIRFLIGLGHFLFASSDSFSVRCTV